MNYLKTKTLIPFAVCFARFGTAKILQHSKRVTHRHSNAGRKNATPSPPRRSRWRRCLLRALLTAAVALLALTAAGTGYLLSLPGVGDAERRVQMILVEHHTRASSMPPPAKLAAAVVAVEDERFYSNFLVDILDGAGRAALAALHTSGDPGGSTIAEQLVKQLYDGGSGLAGTLREVGLGVKLSLHYPKQQILSMYLNAVYYGNGYWGDAAAARGYFRTSPRALDWAQAAMLAGLPPAPSAYDPKTRFVLAKQRQRHVLDQLVVNHILTSAQANAAYRERLAVQNRNTGG
jgi:penicillin-binding protein 1A